MGRLFNTSCPVRPRCRPTGADSSALPAQSDLDFVPQGPAIQHFLPSPTSISCCRGRQFTTSSPVRPRFRAAGGDSSALPAQSELDFVSQGPHGSTFCLNSCPVRPRVRGAGTARSNFLSNSCPVRHRLRVTGAARINF